MILCSGDISNGPWGETIFNPTGINSNNLEIGLPEETAYKADKERWNKVHSKLIQVEWTLFQRCVPAGYQISNVFLVFHKKMFKDLSYESMQNKWSPGRIIFHPGAIVGTILVEVY